MFDQSVEVVRETRNSRRLLFTGRHVEAGQFGARRRSLVPVVDADAATSAAGVYHDGVLNVGLFCGHPRYNNKTTSDEHRHQQSHRWSNNVCAAIRRLANESPVFRGLFFELVA